MSRYQGVATPEGVVVYHLGELAARGLGVTCRSADGDVLFEVWLRGVKLASIQPSEDPEWLHVPPGAELRALHAPPVDSPGEQWVYGGAVIVNTSGQAIVDNSSATTPLEVLCLSGLGNHYFENRVAPFTADNGVGRVLCNGQSMREILVPPGAKLHAYRTSSNGMVSWYVKGGTVPLGSGQFLVRA